MKLSPIEFLNVKNLFLGSKGLLDGMMLSMMHQPIIGLCDVQD